MAFKIVVWKDSVQDRLYGPKSGRFWDRSGELDSLLGGKSDSLAEGKGEAVVVLPVIPAPKGTRYSPTK